MSKPQPTAETLRGAIRLHRTLSAAFPTDANNSQDDMLMLEFLKAKFFRRTGREGLSRTAAQQLLDSDDEAVQAGREKIALQN